MPPSAPREWAIPPPGHLQSWGGTWVPLCWGLGEEGSSAGYTSGRPGCVSSSPVPGMSSPGPWGTPYGQRPQELSQANPCTAGVRAARPQASHSTSLCLETSRAPPSQGEGSRRWAPAVTTCPHPPHSGAWGTGWGQGWPRLLPDTSPALSILQRSPLTTPAWWPRVQGWWGKGVWTTVGGGGARSQSRRAGLLPVSQHHPELTPTLQTSKLRPGKVK